MDFDDHELTKSYVTAHKVDVSTRHVNGAAHDAQLLTDQCRSGADKAEPDYNECCRLQGGQKLSHSDTRHSGSSAQSMSAFRSDNSGGGVRSESSLSVSCARG